jgi:hypothetical protein
MGTQPTQSIHKVSWGSVSSQSTRITRNNSTKIKENSIKVNTQTDTKKITIRYNHSRTYATFLTLLVPQKTNFLLTAI